MVRQGDAGSWYVFLFNMKVLFYVAGDGLCEHAPVFVGDDDVRLSFGFHKGDVFNRPLIKVLFQDVPVAVSPFLKGLNFFVDSCIDNR